MAQNNDIIIPKKAIDGITQANTEIVKLDESTYKFISTVEKLSKELKDNNITLAQVQKAQKKTNESSKTAAQIAEQEAKAKEKQRLATEKAGKAVLKSLSAETQYFKELKKSNKEKEAAAKITAKQAAKEKELVDALKLEVKTEEDAIRQNKALRAVKKQVIQTDEEGIQKVNELNAKINQNTDFLKNSADTFVGTKMNVGDYKNEIVAAAGELEVFGVSVNKATSFLKSGAGVVAAVAAVLVGLGKAYASSARGAEDLARASDRLDSIGNSLGNTLADATGEANLFDNILRGVQTSVLGVANTIKSDLIVGIQSQIRQLEILEADQERQKKSQLNDAEKLRQTRDDERNSIEDRRKANEELGRVINEREAETIKFQKEKLAQYQTLLNLDKGNLEYQRAIKQIEFEIADASEEAQGFRSEQLANDLALSKEYYANKVALSDLEIQNEILKNGESLGLTKKLIQNKLELELEAAGDNEQLRNIALQTAKNETLKAEKETNDAIKAYEDERIANIEALTAENDKNLQKRLGDYENYISEKQRIDEEAKKASSVVFEQDEEEEIEEDDFGDLGARLAAMIDFAKQAAKDGQAQADDELAMLDNLLANKLISEEEYASAKEKIEADSAAKTKEKILQGLAIAQQASDALFNAYNARLENEQTALTNQRAYELSLANGNAREEAKINDKFDKKEIELKKKQDKASKNQSLFKIALSTAVAVASASPLVPLMIIAAALGAIQFAVAASQPLPQYWTGIDKVPTDGPVVVGDRGRELIKKDGKFSIANQPTITSGLKGAKVYNNKETEMLLNGRSGGSSIDISELKAEQKETNEILRKMGKLPIHKKGTYDIFKDQIKYPV